MNKLIRTPITYYGGKQRLAERILQLIPEHKIYCEPFFGGGAVFFVKPKSYLEVINDINNRLMTFYKQVQNNFDELQEMVANSLHSESDYLRAKEIYFGNIEATDTEIAWSVWILTNMSYSGSPIGGWKWCNGASGSHAGVFMLRKRDEFTKGLKTRLQTVQISSRDAITVIKQRDTEHTFFYLDPPYPNCDQKHYRGYTTDDLKELLITLQDITCDDCDCTDGCYNNCCYDCDNCFFYKRKQCIDFLCIGGDRNDKTDVVFLEVKE